MGIEWYDMIAKRNGGYRSDAKFTVEGTSGEDVFEERLISMLPDCNEVLDAGCGHGDFTMKMAKHTKRIVGFDFSKEMIKIANSLKDHYKIDNVDFIYASTKGELPFKDDQFDLIYSRRGPGSIANHSRILRPKGTIFGICPEYPNIIDKITGFLKNNGFINIKIEIFDNAVMIFPDEIEFSKFLRDFPGNVDYTLPENRDLLKQKIEENMVDGRLCWKQWRFIWKAVKP